MTDTKELVRILHRALLKEAPELHLTVDEKWNIRVMHPDGDFYISVDSFDRETWTVTQA